MNTQHTVLFMFVESGLPGLSRMRLLMGSFASQPWVEDTLLSGLLVNHPSSWGHGVAVFQPGMITICVKSKGSSVVWRALSEALLLQTLKNALCRSAGTVVVSTS